MASANAFIRFAISNAGAEAVGLGGPHQQNDIGVVCLYVGCTTGVAQGGAMIEVALKGLTGMLQVAAWLLLTLCGGVDCRV